jgi:hypothetical protein
VCLARVPFSRSRNTAVPFGRFTFADKRSPGTRGWGTLAFEFAGRYGLGGPVSVRPSPSRRPRNTTVLRGEFVLAEKDPPAPPTTLPRLRVCGGTMVLKPTAIQVGRLTRLRPAPSWTGVSQHGQSIFARKRTPAPGWGTLSNEFAEALWFVSTMVQLVQFCSTFPSRITKDPMHPEGFGRKSKSKLLST